MLPSFLPPSSATDCVVVYLAWSKHRSGQPRRVPPLIPLLRRKYDDSPVGIGVLPVLVRAADKTLRLHLSKRKFLDVVASEGRGRHDVRDDLPDGDCLSGEVVE